MPIRVKNTATDYGLAGRIMHWSTAGLVMWLFIGSGTIEDMAEGAERDALLAQHISLGLCVLILMSARAYWRLTNPNPVMSYKIASWQKFAAKSVHWTLYALVLSQAFTGIISVLTDGGSIAFFDFVSLGPWFEPVPVLHDFTASLHAAISTTLLYLVGLHVTAATYHQIFGVVD